MVTVADAAAGGPDGSGDRGGPLNYGLYKTFGAEFAVELAQAAGRRHRAAARRERRQGPQPADRLRCRAERPGVPDGGAPRWPMRSRAGPAAPRAWPRPVSCSSPDGRIYRIDSDGDGARAAHARRGRRRSRRCGRPTAERIAYTRLGAGGAASIVQPLRPAATPQVARRADRRSTSRRRSRPTASTLAFAHSDEQRHRYLHRERRRALLRATLDRGTLRGQLVTDIFAQTAGASPSSPPAPARRRST